MTTIINKTPLEFTELKDEWREYVFSIDGVMTTYRVDKPRFINVNPVHGAHRILDADGVVHYLPGNFTLLRWKVEDGTPHFHTTVAQMDGSTQQVKHD